MRLMSALQVSAVNQSRGQKSQTSSNVHDNRKNCPITEASELDNFRCTLYHLCTLGLLVLLFYDQC